MLYETFQQCGFRLSWAALCKTNKLPTWAPSRPHLQLAWLNTDLLPAWIYIHKGGIWYLFLPHLSTVKFVPEKQNKTWFLSRTKSTEKCTYITWNSDSFIIVCSYKKGLVVESQFILEINDLFTEIGTLQFSKAGKILLRIRYQNSDKCITV